MRREEKVLREASICTDLGVFNRSEPYIEPQVRYWEWLVRGLERMQTEDERLRFWILPLGQGAHGRVLNRSIK